MTGKRGLWGFRYDTTHPKINHYKMHFRFLSAKWNAATRYSARPFTTKTGARVHFFCLNSPRNRGWYQARVHPFSSGNILKSLKSLQNPNKQQLFFCSPHLLPVRRCCRATRVLARPVLPAMHLHWVNITGFHDVYICLYNIVAKGTK